VSQAEFVSIEEGIEEIRAGRMLIVVATVPGPPQWFTLGLSLAEHRADALDLEAHAPGHARAPQVGNGLPGQPQQGDVG